jgi:hypothetical protein
MNPKVASPGPYQNQDYAIQDRRSPDQRVHPEGRGGIQAIADCLTRWRHTDQHG